MTAAIARNCHAISVTICFAESAGNAQRISSMSDIVDITKNLPHKVSEVICVKCGHRWIAVRPEDSKLRDLECPNCTKQGYAIETGEVLNGET